jgi:hypothetical protein
MQLMRRLGSAVLITVVLVGCGGGTGQGSSPTTQPASITVNGETYTRATDVQVAGTSSLYVKGQLYLAPYPLADYPRTSMIVVPVGHVGAYIWTGSQLVLLVPPCAIQARGTPGAC